MIDGHKVIAFTPVGRKRYLDLLITYMKREHDVGHIDEWILFNNPIVPEEGGLARQIKKQFGDWITILENSACDDRGWRQTSIISTFYKQIPVDLAAVYIRLDDDIVFIDKNAIERLVHFRIAHPSPFLVYPSIINNVRICWYMQQAGILPTEEFGDLKTTDMWNLIAWTSDNFINKLHAKALTSIANGTIAKDFELPSRHFANYEDGYISVNSYCILGCDLALSYENCPGDEERYFALNEPIRLGRTNAMCGDAIMVHFSYHKQEAYMDRTGMLGDYARFTDPVGFMTTTSPPPPIDPTREQRFQMTAERLRLIDVLQIPG